MMIIIRIAMADELSFELGKFAVSSVPKDDA